MLTILAILCVIGISAAILQIFSDVLEIAKGFCASDN